MSSDNVTSDITQGVVKAWWDIGKKEFGDLINKFRNGDLFFINDSDTIEDVKKQRKESEFVTIKKHISSSIHRALIASGIGARNLSDKKAKKLYKNVKSAHGFGGLAIIHLVENNLLTRYFSHLVSMSFTPKQFSDELNDFLKNITNRVQFIETNDKPTKCSKKAVTQINAHQPIMYIISAVHGATSICTKAAKSIKSQISGYTVETITLTEPKRRIYLFIRK